MPRRPPTTFVPTGGEQPSSPLEPLVNLTWARRIRVGSSIGLVTCGAVIAASFVSDRPIEGAGLLLILGLPVLVLGQLFTIGKALMDQGQPEGSRRRGLSVRHLISGLPLWQGATLGLIAVGGWLLSMTTWFVGGPATTAGSCEAILSEGGIERCVDRSDLVRYQAAGQRFAAGVLLAFFCIHLAAALATIARERASSPPGGAGTSF